MLKISGSPLCRVFSSLTTTLTPVSLLLIILFFKGWKNRKTQAVPEKSVPGGGEGDARLLLPQDHKALQGEGSEDIWGGGGIQSTPLLRAAACPQCVVAGSIVGRRRTPQIAASPP